MKIDRLIAAVAFVAAVAVAPVLAQTKPATQPTQQPAQTNAPLPESKIALVDTEAFGDEKQGIVRLVAAAKKVEASFDIIRKDLLEMQKKIQQLTDEITKLRGGPGIVPEQQIRAKVDQLEQLKIDAKRKQEDAEAAYPKKMQEALAPVYIDIFKALDAYGKARGITLLLDAAKMGPAILIAAETMDITRAFIADFNSKNPATAQVTPPPK